ncbi:MAG: response regulator [Acidobacteriota bacterium]
MILVVDDDPKVLEEVSASLTTDGYSHTCLKSAEEALRASEHEPDLILVDADLPGMSGSQLLQEYGRRYPHRCTPFVLLSASDDPEVRVQALDLGAEGFLSKPLHMDTLRAELRAVLLRKTRYTAPTFYGDLSLISLPRLLRFCADRSITGEVVVSAESRHARVQLRGGEVVPPDAGEIVEFMAGLYDLRKGTCVLHVNPLDFRDIEKATMPLSTMSPGREKPVGRLSAVRVEARQFQLQTEMTSLPRDRIVTIVAVAGKIILKRESLPPDGAARQQLDALIETQHRTIEGEIRERTSAPVVRRMKDIESRNERFRMLYESGCDRYEEKDYHGAMKNWDEAGLIKPDDPALLLGLQIVRKKLGLPPIKRK